MILQQNGQSSQIQQRSINLKLTYQVIKIISQKLKICSNYINLEDSRKYRGKKLKYQGRIYIKLTNNKSFKYIIIDKNPNIRYLVEQLQSNINPQQQYKHISHFIGYKIEFNKYLIHGNFQYFQMKQFSELFGIENIYQQQCYFCKIANQQIVKKYSFQKTLQLPQPELSQQILPTSQIEYFQQKFSIKTLNKLNGSHAIDTKIINHIFERIKFAYYSLFWYENNKKKMKLKIMQSQRLSFFFKDHQDKDYDYDYYCDNLFNIYDPIHKNIFEQQQIIVFPIHDGRFHFVLGIFKYNKNIVQLYGLDPFDYQENTWIQKLQKIIEYNHRYLKQHNISYNNNKQDLKIQFYQSIEILQAPRQQVGTVDCGIFIILYMMLFLQKFEIISINTKLKDKYLRQYMIQQLISYIRKSIYESYMQKDIYFFQIFGSKFEQFYEKFMDKNQQNTNESHKQQNNL